MSTVNIDSQGYGKIYQSVMRDRNMSLITKSIYAYFCAYAGSGNKAYPKREKIVKDLQINKDTFTKHLGTLVEEGYISKERTTNGNLYTIMQSVPTAPSSPFKAIEMTDMLVMESIQARGFGTVPKLLMFDQRLTAQAKAIYAYFASFAGAGTTAFPRRSTIMRELKLGEKGYYPHFKLLLDTGYLSVETQRQSGKFDVSIYHMAERIAIPLNLSCKLTSEKPLHGGELLKTPEESLGMSEKGVSDKCVTDKSIHGNFGHANIKISNKTNSSFEQEHGDNHQAPPLLDETKPARSYFVKWVKEQMDYEFLQKETIALCELKTMLGHFSSPEDHHRFQNTIREILAEIPRVILWQLQTNNDGRILVGATRCRMIAKSI